MNTRNRPPIFRGFSRAELEREYSPSHLANLSLELARYSEVSAQARAALPWRELQYGSDPAARLDFFPATEPRGPLVAFIHGGYWQELGKADASFPALGLADRGIAYAAIGYGLAPTYRMDQIVAMVRAAMMWLHDHAGLLGYEPGQLYLAGSSAGGQLAAMCLMPGWLPGGMNPAGIVSGAVLLSGVYDLAPLLETYVNDALGMDGYEAERNSPQRYLPTALPPLLLALGERETNEFARQQQEFADAARVSGTDVTELVAAGRNHYDVAFDVTDDTSELGKAVTALIDRTHSHP